VAEAVVQAGFAAPAAELGLTPETEPEVESAVAVAEPKVEVPEAAVAAAELEVELELEAVFVTQLGIALAKSDGAELELELELEPPVGPLATIVDHQEGIAAEALVNMAVVEELVRDFAEDPVGKHSEAVVAAMTLGKGCSEQV